MLTRSLLALALLTGCTLSGDNRIKEPSQKATLGPALPILKATMDEAEALEDIGLIRGALENIHPGYIRFTTKANLDEMWSALEANAQRGMTETELYLGLVEIVAAIRCDHTKIEFSEPMIDERDVEPVYLPFRFRTFDGRMYVDAPGETGLSRGTEILQIDGDDATDRLARVASLISVDGFTDHTRWETVESSTEELGSGFDHYDPLLNPSGQTVSITFRSFDGEVGTRTYDRLTYPQFRAITGEPRRRNFSDDDAITVTYPAEGVAYLRINTFVNYRTPVDPNTVFEPLFEAFSERGIKTLILDNRQNGGGSTDVQNALLAHLMGSYTKPVTDIRVRTIDVSAFKPHLSTWEALALDPPAQAFIDHGDGWYSIRPGLIDSLEGFDAADSGFDGQLILLTSRANASGATQMTGVLRQRENTLLIGEQTGGTQRGPNGGVIYFLTLPNTGFVVRVPWQFWRSNIKAPEHGVGFAPDIETPITLESWLAEKDVALSAALSLATRPAP